jgi:hypothetical protein
LESGRCPLVLQGQPLSKRFFLSMAVDVLDGKLRIAHLSSGLPQPHPQALSRMLWKKLEEPS